MGRGLLFLAGPLSLTGWQHVPVLRPLCVQVSPKEPALMLAKAIDSHVMEGGAEVSLFFGVLLQQALHEGYEGAAVLLLFLFLVLWFVIRLQPLQC
jgi:hypothetical protein